MYKVYLSLINNLEKDGTTDYDTKFYRVNEIADQIEKELIKGNNFVVYTNKRGMKKEEIIKDINIIKPDVYVAINIYNGNNECFEIFTKVGCEISNGFAKEIYKELDSVWPYKIKDKGVIYNDKIKEMMNINFPGILINIGCYGNDENIKGLLNNKYKIAVAIKSGIVNASKLKPC